MSDKFGMPIVDCSDKAVIECLKAKLSAAEKERDEALAWGNWLYEAVTEIDRQLETGFIRCERCGDQEDTATMDVRSWPIADALQVPAPTALSHLRQEIRMEFAGEVAKLCESKIDRERQARLEHESRKAKEKGEEDDEIRRLRAWSDVLMWNNAHEQMAAAIRRLAEEAKEQEGKND